MNQACLYKSSNQSTVQPTPFEDVSTCNINVQTPSTKTIMRNGHTPALEAHPSESSQDL